MPPLPRAERISYEPSLVPAARAMKGYREGVALIVVRLPRLGKEALVSPATRSAKSSEKLANRSAHSQAKGMPRGFRPACRTVRADAGTDSATRRFARRPNATAPSRCYVPCGALRPMAVWRDLATPVGL